MNEVQTLIEQIAKHWGWEVGDKVRQEIEAVIAAENVDIKQLQNAISVIQGLLDADPGTEEFDVGQNIVTQLTDHLTRITSLESDVATLKGDETVVGSVAYAVKQERDRAVAAEGNLQSAIDNETQARQDADAQLQAQIDELRGGDESTGAPTLHGLQNELDATQAGAGLEDDGSYAANTSTNYISDATSLKDADEKLDAAIKNTETIAGAASAKADANEAAINVLNGDETVEGSVKKTAKDYAEAAKTEAVNAAKEYADETFVSKEQIANISAATLASIFRQALDCGFNGAPKDDVLNGTGDCAQANSGGGDGDGAVL